MSSRIYSGPSDGFSDLADGYVDYAMEVIARRAVPDVRDGLKPVTRRILYQGEQGKKDYMQKCASIVGDTIKIHPHGDNSIYEAFALYTDENGSCNIPFFKGMGNLGKVFSSDKPAGMRYPKFKMHDNAFLLFKDKDVMDLVTSEEGEGLEPKVLNAIIPLVLVNGAMGIAVSAGTKMPSFNLSDVLDLTIKYAKTRKLDVNDMIIPDFPTGGVLVCNKEEIAKIMLTGKAKLKIRAKVEIEGAMIHMVEVPYGKTAEGIVSAIKEAEVPGVVGSIVSTGRGSVGLVTVTCKSKKIVEEVLMDLYHRNIFQNTFGSNILVIDDGIPKLLGVFGVVETWFAWRETVVKKKISHILEVLRNDKIIFDYFIRLVSNESWRDTYVDRVIHNGKAKGKEYLEEIFPDIPLNVSTWISGRSISAFHNGDSYLEKYNQFCTDEEYWTKRNEDTSLYIIEELEEVKKKMAKKYPRKTEISYTDYKFSKLTDSDEIEDESYCVYTLKKDGFLTKTRDLYLGNDTLCQIQAKANSILIGFDNFGRVLRVIGKEIPFTPTGDSGEYMPKYFEATFEENYKVLYLGLLDGTKRMLVYRDGYIGYLDTMEYLGKKNIKIVSKGICLAVMDKLLHVYEEKDIPMQILLADDSTGKVRLGVVNTNSIAERSRISRAKVLSGDNINTKYLKGFNDFELVKYLEDPDQFMGKLKIMKSNFLGNPCDLEDGDYIDLCKDTQAE